MAIAQLALKNFTVFAEAKLELCPGINVLVGDSATGKTHALKLLHASRTALDIDTTSGTFAAHIARAFFGAGKPALDHLHRDGATGDLELVVTSADGRTQKLKTSRSAAQTLGAALRMNFDQPAPTSVFIPSRDVLDMFPGLYATFEQHDLGLDATYYDLCRQLSAVRSRRAPRSFDTIVAPLEHTLGGTVVLSDHGFFIQNASGLRSAALLAEGERKLATLTYLMAHGAVRANSTLCLDNPESGLAPRLITKMVETLRQLAHAGVQIFLASHDCLLVHRLSQATEHALAPVVPTRFFAFHRDDPSAPVQIESADTLAQIQHNTILAEFARYHDDEQLLTLRDLSTAPVKPPLANQLASRKTGKRRAAKEPDESH